MEITFLLIVMHVHSLPPLCKLMPESCLTKTTVVSDFHRSCKKQLLQYKTVHDTIKERYLRHRIWREAIITWPSTSPNLTTPDFPCDILFEGLRMK